MKLALAMICKGDKNEAELLSRCLDSISEHVDGIFITGTYLESPKEAEPVREVAEKYGATFSSFQWVHDFAKARNHNFSQVPKDYDYILWCDADDVWDKPENIKPFLMKHPSADAVAFWYLYDFDEYLNPTVVHKKTQIIRNDGCATWKGKLHEDLIENRSLNVLFTEEARRIHRTTDERVIIAKARNVEVAEMDAKEHPEDPRTLWNLGNSYVGNGEYDKARIAFLEFIERSASQDEKYIALLRLSECEEHLGKYDDAFKHVWHAIGMSIDIPDGYFRCGQMHFNRRNWKEAEKYYTHGLVLKPNYHRFIVYNPREYDYNPLMALSKIYIQMARPDRAVECLKACLEISPKDTQLKGLIDELEKQAEFFRQAVAFVAKTDGLSNEDFKKQYDKLDITLRSHPAVVLAYNKRFIKTETSGKDIVYFCEYTPFDWNPELMKTKGFGGSEEAVMNLAKQWAKKGYNVVVYNSCGVEPLVSDGVTYKPFWMFNYRDACDVFIAWRHPRVLDLEINAKKIYVDLHDVMSPGEFPQRRLDKIDKIFVKTQFHRSLLEGIPDEKIAIVPNGMDFELFDQEVEKDQYLMVNTSSPDRSLDVLPELFRRVKERVPQAKMKWVYGFDNLKTWYANDPVIMKWMEDTIKKMEEVGMENLGRVTQKETAKLLLQANIFAYPTEFAEIDCISVKKAQACGALPVTTDFAALDESVQFGVKVRSDKNKDNWSKPGQFTYGLKDKKAQDEWVDACVKILQTPIEDRSEMKKWTERFTWEKVADEWCAIIGE